MKYRILHRKLNKPAKRYALVRVIKRNGRKTHKTISHHKSKTAAEAARSELVA